MGESNGWSKGCEGESWIRYPNTYSKGVCESVCRVHVTVRVTKEVKNVCLLGIMVRVTKEVRARVGVEFRVVWVMRTGPNCMLNPEPDRIFSMR